MNSTEFTNIPIGLTDSKDNVILGVRWQDICTRFHRVNPETINIAWKMKQKLL